MAARRRREDDGPSGIGPETQRIYTSLAARDGDFRALHRRGMKETPAMRDAFVILRAKWLAWLKENPNYEQLPDWL